MFTRVSARAALRNVQIQSRGLSSLSRTSAIALGKRPAMPTVARVSFVAGSSRALSMPSWLSRSSDVTVVPETSAVQPVNGAVSSQAPVSSNASAIPVNPVESAQTSAPIEASTSSAPTFHEDPATLLPQPPATSTVPTLEDMVVNSGMSVEEILQSPEAVHAAIKLSDMKLIGLEHGWFSLPGWMTDVVVSMHLQTGLPWWGSIAATTIMIRLCLVPLVLRNMKHNVRLAAVQPQMTALMKRLNEAKTSGDIVARNTTIQTLQGLMKQHDVSPFRPLLMPALQFPFFLSLFWGLQKLARLPLPQLKEGGFAWVTDLTLADPYYILPITSIVLTQLVLKVGQDGTASATQATANMAHFANGLQVLSPLFVYMIGSMPAAVLFYWTSTNTFTLIQALILRQPFIKRMLNIPAPVAKPLPPGTAPINTNPSYAETWKVIKDTINERSAAAHAAQASALTRTAASANRQQALKSLPNRVREGGKSQSGFLEKPGQSNRKA